ncbi:MAG: DUF4956 domain-containing protein [Gemmatimonadales bacterium]|nr:DUF4956 domain-containing protein [Gemmatimonadales bacterium]
MRATELPSAAPAPAGSGGLGRAVYAKTVRRIVDRFTYPAERPFVTLLLYYLLVGGLGWLAIRYIPGAEEMISGSRLLEIRQAPGLTDAVTGPAFAWNISASMALSMVGAFVLMLPASWVYMATRRRKGFDQQVVQTFIVLAVAVAGVVIIARNSVALAFSLAGVVGAVRFRNTLPETRDTLFIFLAIGVGLAAGVEALTAALVLSLVFNFIVLILHRADYAMCELGTNPRQLLVGAKPADTGKKVRDFNAVLLVRAKDADKARPAVEAILEGEVRRYQLAEIETTSKGKGVLKYLIRLGRRVEPATLEDALLTRAAPNVVGARIH